MQIISYLACFGLVVCGWHLPRVRNYVGAFLVADLIRLALLQIPSKALVLYALDGLLVMTGPVLLAYCLRLDCRPVAGLASASVVIALFKVHGGDGAATIGVYVAASLAAGLYTTIASVGSKAWRQDFDVSDGILLGLSSTGTAGALVVVAWGQWELAQLGNVVAHLLLSVLCLLSRRQDTSV